MTFKRPGLGKNLANLGLKELLSDLNANETATKVSGVQFRKLPIEFLHSGKYQPRQSFDQVALEELASSIKTQGLLQPIIVRKEQNQDQSYEIIAGERRWRAAQLANLHEVPVIIRELSDHEALAIALIENIQRENLNVIDEAEALRRLGDEFSMTHEEIADVVGKSRATVTNTLRLLHLMPEVKELVLNGQLEMGHARALLALPTEAQKEAARIIFAKHLSVREAEKLVRNLQNQKPSKTEKEIDPNVLKLEIDLSEKLGARVMINQKNRSNGQLIIEYRSLAELDGLIEKITKSQLDQHPTTT